MSAKKPAATAVVFDLSQSILTSFANGIKTRRRLTYCEIHRLAVWAEELHRAGRSLAGDTAKKDKLSGKAGAIDDDREDDLSRRRRCTFVRYRYRRHQQVAALVVAQAQAHDDE